MALLELHKEMLQKPPSAPMNNYIFRVNFHLDSIYNNQSLGYTLDNDTDRSMIAIKADLPAFETSIVQKHFLGSEKSYPILRKYGGDTTIEFYTHTDPHENNFIVYNFFKQLKNATPSNSYYYHKEFNIIFNRIEIVVGDRAGGNPTYIYHLRNCIVTKVDTGALTYEGQDALKYTMTVHYDDWTIAEQDVVENEQEGKGTR